jgi:hypothetical protein
MLFSKRTTLGWSSVTVPNEPNEHIEFPSSQTDASASTSASKPRRNELATSTELQDGRAKYTSAKSLSKIQGFRKGLLVALLLDLDILPSPSNLDELWAMNKPALATLLWNMVRYKFYFSVVTNV